MQWSDEELNILTEEYGKVKIKVLVEKLGRTPSSIRWKAQELKIKANRSITNSKNSLNELFFSVPNPVNCYIAGLIAADGSINTERKNLWFFQKDKFLVQYIKDSVKSTNNIWHRKRKNSEEYSICFTNKRLVEDLKTNFGIQDNKSINGLPIPNLQNIELVMCYIAGLIDGDGSISYRKHHPNGKFHLSFTLLCSKILLDWINDITNSSMPILKRNDCKVDLWKMYSSHKKAYMFLNDIYKVLIKNNIPISNKFQKINKYEMENN